MFFVIDTDGGKEQVEAASAIEAIQKRGAGQPGGAVSRDKFVASLNKTASCKDGEVCVAAGVSEASAHLALASALRRAGK
jgi:hypothetical protein